MQRLKLSLKGPEISRLSFGCWRLLEDPQGASATRVQRKIELCLENGISTFDHADIYGGYECEEAFGQALREKPELRDHMEIITKCGIMLTTDNRPQNKIKHYDYTAKHISDSVESSLKALGTDRIDVLLYHRPSPLMSMQEVAEVSESLRKAGKVLHFGVSNFTPAQFRALNAHMPLVTNQVEVNPLTHEPFLDGTLDLCQELNFKPMAWSPLAGGKLFKSTDPQHTRTREALQLLAKEKATSLDLMTFAWLMKHPSEIGIVLGTNIDERIVNSVKALGIELTTQEWFQVWSAFDGTEVP